ncbi:MAG: hypothetical protein JW967_06690 [Dehalococcoidales bacterium]|nr:hypothetical protein [Dehalococcoidales bacterium]
MKRKPTRIILGYKNENYKLMNFFTGEQDNSFYFHIYRKPNEFPMRDIKRDIKNETSNELRIHFPDFVPTEFNENHMSFHEKGYIHSTDAVGNRYHDGIIGIPFSKIDTYLFALVVAPKHPSNLIKLTRQKDSTRDIHIALQDDVQPFGLHFAFYKKGAILPKPPPDLIGGGFVACEYDDKVFGLLLAMKKVVPGIKGGSVAWPPFTVILKRIG